MKNFKFLALCTVMISSTHLKYAQHQTLQSQQTSLLAWMTSNLNFLPQQPALNLLPAQESNKKAIIFDLNGILCSTNKLTAAYLIGADTISSYLLHHPFALPSKKDLFQALQQVPAVSTATAFYDGELLPQIMVDWKAGLQDSRDIQDAIANYLEHAELTTAQKNLYLQTALMMTTPEKFIQTKQIITQGLQLAHTLKKLGYKIYILSNWDPTSFPLFMKNFPDFFTYEGKDLFDGIMISGQQHCLKPDPKIFQACLTKFDIDPAQAIFIDDAPENVLAAQDLGIDAILCQDKNINKLTQDVATLLIKQ